MAVLSRGQITISNLVDGKISHTHQAWADGIVNGIGSVGFSLADSIGKKYTGFYSDFSEQASTDPSKYKWVETSNAIEQEIAYAWSPDGTDRFARVKPNENLWSISNSILGKFQNWRDGLSLYDNPARFTSDFLPIKEGEEYWISSNYASYNFSVFLYKDTSSNAGLRLNDSNKNANSWVTLSSNGGGITSGGFKIPSGYSYMRLSANVTNSDIATPDLIISRKVKLEKSDKATIYTANPQDDYDNAVPRYIGHSLKDSTNPADFKWEPNPDRKPWTAYAQGLNGEGLSLMPYGENKILDSSFESSGLSLGTVNSATKTYDTSKKHSGNRSVKVVTGTTTTDSGLSIQYSGLTVGIKYTLSVYVYTNNDNMTLRLRIANTSLSGQQQNTSIAKGDWQRVDYTFIAAYANGYYLLMDQNITFWVDDIKLELANTMGIPTPWIPAPSEDPLGAIPKYVGTAALPYEDPYKYEWRLNPAWLQQESNNNLANKVDNDTYNNDQSTVWEEISNRVTEEEAQAIQESLNKITGAYTDFVSTGGKHDQDLANLKSAINTDIQKLADKVLGFDFVNTWFRIGDGGLSIGEANSNFEILVSNDQITFYDSGTAVAYVSNQSFFINSGMIVDDLQIGKFKFAKVNDNLMGLFHIA